METRGDRRYKLEFSVREGVFVVHTARDHRVLHKDSPESDFEAADYDTMRAKQYSRDLRRRAIESMTRKAESGWFPTKAPLGYINEKLRDEHGQSKDQGSTIALPEWGRKLVRRMRDLRLANHSLESIAETVLREDIVPKRHQTRFRGKGRKSAVERVLKDVFYKGLFAWRDKVYAGKHEPVFNVTEWDELQETFGQRAPQQRHKHDGVFMRADFRIRCAECGCLVVFEPKKKGAKVFRYYHCTDGRRTHERQVNVSEDSILEQLGGALDAIRITEDLATAIADALSETHRKAQVAKAVDADRYRANIVALDEKENRLYDRLDTGEIDSDTYRQQRERVRAERDAMFNKLRVNDVEVDGAYLVTAKRVLELAKNAKVLWESRSSEERRDLLAKLLQNPVLDGKSVRYDLRKPFRILSEMRQGEKWRGGRDSNPRPPA